MSTSSLAIDIDKVSNGTRDSYRDDVALEEPLEIQVCAASGDQAAAQSISITMRTPGHDVDLALGFLYSEAIIRSIGDVRSAAPVGPHDGDTGLQNTVRVEFDPGVSFDREKLARHFYTTSSCGVCGKASLDALRVSVPDFARRDFSITHQALTLLPERLRERQQLFDTTGGLHAAAAFEADGRLVLAREDVGRHNAVDKVIGALLAEGRLPATDLGLIVSGRASFELMQKTLVAGMPMLAAISAPSSLAVRLSREYDLTLVGFLRDRNFNIYSAAQRVLD